VSADGDLHIAAIEDAFVAHWSFFGRWSHGILRDDDGVEWFETPIARLPYNMVMKTRIASEIDADSVIERVAAGFRARDVPYLWVQRPSDRPHDLGHRLAQQGLDLVETVTGMDLELDGWVGEPNRGPARIVAVDSDAEGLRDYVELTRTYWSVPDSERHLLELFQNEWAADRSPGVRLLAYVDEAPVGKLFMNTIEVPSRVGIYGVAVKPEGRGLGIATALMTEAMVRAQALGASRSILHSSDMAYSLYGRMGFIERCKFGVYATGPLFGTHHH
jgi:ribosomal protein S18 acetylase RimI-like enzyme